MVECRGRGKEETVKHQRKKMAESGVVLRRGKGPVRQRKREEWHSNSCMELHVPLHSVVE